MGVYTAAIQLLAALLMCWPIECRPQNRSNVTDPCASWLVDTFGGQNLTTGWCSALAKDTVRQFFHSAGILAPYEKLDACSCGASALFALWMFSGVPSSWQPTTGLPVLNYTLQLYQWANMFSSQTHRTWPQGCIAPSPASHSATMLQLHCALGLPPCAVDDEPMPRAVQVGRGCCDCPLAAALPALDSSRRRYGWTRACWRMITRLSSNARQPMSGTSGRQVLKRLF